MTDPGGLDRPLIFAYDNGPANGLPIAPRPDGARGPRPRWPRRPDWLRWPSRPRLQFRLRRPHPFRRMADFLILLTAADPEQIPSRPERFRYITVGLLMLVTVAQAFYAATLFMSVSLGKPFSSEIGYGVFFATAVYLIDRSIVSFAAPIKLDGEKEYLLPPKKTSWVVAIRVSIAIAAALLMSEMILLQVFAGDIGEQIQTDHLGVTKATNQQIEINFQKRINTLQGQINSAQNVVDQRQKDVDNAYQAMNCQEFGCPAEGIVAGFGQGYAAAKVNWQNAVILLKNARTQLQNVRDADQPQIKQLNTEEQQAIKAAQPAISNADKVLSQEEAFWQLTIKNGTVLAVRLLLSLLILGIDLAPILTKLTGRSSTHDIVAHSGDYQAQEKEKQKARTAVHQFAKEGEINRRVRDTELDSTLFRAEQAADVARAKLQRQADVARAAADAKADAELYRIDLDARLTRLTHYRAYIARQADAANGHAGSDGNPGGPGRSRDHAGGLGDPARHAASGSGGRARGPGRPPGRPGGYTGTAGGRSSVAHPAAGPVNESDLAVNAYVPAPLASPDERQDVPIINHEAAIPAPPPDPDPIGPPGHPADFSPPAPRGSSFGQTRLIDEMAEVFASEERMGKLVLNRKWVLERVMPGADPGSGGIVWLAHPRGKPRARYVVKTVASELADKRTRRYIQQLGVRHEQRAAKVTSDHIGQIVDHGDDQGFFYLVYPLYQPGSLWAYCSWKGEWPLDWCVQVIDDVLSGLIDAFAFNLVHLDVKPNNVVLDGERVRVIDWGLSRVWNASQPSTWVANGTPFFACPEQFINPQQGFDTPLADLYGVGATFYWLLTGEGPLRREAREAGEGSDPLAYGKLLVAGRRPQLVHDLVPGIPRQLGNLIDRWLSLEPRERMPRETRPEGSLRVARNQLRELRSGLPEMNVGRVTARRHKRRHWK